MLKFKTLLLALFMVCACALSAQVVYTEPPMIQKSTQNFKVYFNAAKGAAGLKGYTGDVYAHAGVVTNKSNGAWTYVKADWGSNPESTKLTREGTDLYSLTISDIRTFYGITDAEEIVEKLAFVFYGTGGTPEGKDTGNKDIFVDVHEDGLAVDITTTSTQVFTPSNNKIPFTVYSTQDATISLYINDMNSAPVATGTGTKLSYTHTFAQGDYTVYATATVNGETKVDEMALCCRRNSSAATYSGTLKQGATMNSDGSVTFCLYAPKKNNVMLVGEWNDYKFTNDQMMNYQGSKYFWYTVPAGVIEAGKDYAYWFIVDDTIECGDPYAKLVLDPWNDKWINEYSEVYPNLKSYPEKATGNFIVSVFNSKRDEYNWEVTDFKAPKKDDLLIYELLFRDFARREATLTNEYGQPYQGTVMGTVETAMARLDYLKALGVNAIELMPIMEFSGNNSWGYNPNFYFAPDKAYGTPEMYKKFIDECHKRGMAVIVDVVFNHADNHPWCTMYWNPNGSPYACPSSDNPFFNVSAPHNWSVFNDWKQEVTHVQDYFCDVLKYWVKEYKVDGFRFDLAKGMGASDSYSSDYDASRYNSSRITYMKKYTDAIKSANPNAYAIYEYFVDGNEENEMANHGGLSWNNQNHNFTNAVNNVQSGSSFSGMNAYGKVGYMESHDEERLAFAASSVGLSNRLRRLASAAAFMIMSPGAKMIWQFGEVGYDISIGTEDSRTSEKESPWGWVIKDESNDDFKYSSARVNLLNSYKQLCWIRRTNPDLFDIANQFNTSKFNWSVSDSNWSNGRFITLRNNDGTKEMVVAWNPGSKKATLNYKFDKTSGYYVNSYFGTGSAPEFDAAAGTISLAAHSYVVISNMENATSGVEDVESGLTEAKVKIYPNPATDYVNVEAEDVKAVEIYSMAGVLVASEKQNSTVDVSGLAKGTYLVKVTAADGVKVEKLIKK